MPMYVYACQCGTEFEQFAKVANRQQFAECPKCGSEAPKIITPARIAADYDAYQCPITGKEIRGRAAHLDNLRRHDCHVHEPGEKEAAERVRAKRERAFDAEIGESVEKAIEQMDGRTLERLGNELAAGAEISLTSSTVTG